MTYLELLADQEVQLWTALGREMKLTEENARLKVLLSDARAEIQTLNMTIETQLKLNTRT